MMRRAMAAMPPSNRFSEIAVQLAPALDELNAIGDDLPSTLALKRDRDDPEAHQSQIQAIEVLARQSRRKPEAARPRLDSLPTPPEHGQGPHPGSNQPDRRSRCPRRYLDTGDLSQLNGSEGLLKMKSAATMRSNRFSNSRSNICREQVDPRGRAEVPEAGVTKNRCRPTGTHGFLTSVHARCCGRAQRVITSRHEKAPIDRAERGVVPRVVP